MGMRVFRKGVVGASVLALVLSGIAVSANADDITDQDIEKAQENEKATQNDIASTEVRLAELSANANDLRISAAQAQAASITAQQQLAEAITEAMDAQDAANKANLEVEAARAELSRVSLTIYRKGAFSLSGADYIMGAKSFQEANARSDAYRILNKKTNRDFERLQAVETVAQTLQKRADDKAKRQQDAAALVEENAAAAAQASQNVETQVAAIEQERTTLIDKLAQQKGTTAELIREQQDQREAAARAAAEEKARQLMQEAERKAAQKAEEEAKRQAAAQQSADAARREAERQEAAKRRAEQEERERKERERQAEESKRKETTPPRTTPRTPSQPTPAPVPPASGTGQQLVAYARQFIGSPYVWGGTTPAGWDCVGFTHYVFSHFGYSTPRRTGQTVGQFWGGYTIVPASQRQPGDLMWWPGHTGIYTGNGMHIAAWNPSMGTQERAVWGNPTYIRILK